MTEHLTPSSSPNRDKIIDVFKVLAAKYGPIDPVDLPDDDPDVATAYEQYYAWQKLEVAKLGDSATTEQELEHEFMLTTLMSDAGLGGVDYIADVANDWLIQTHDHAEEAGLGELAARIRSRIIDLNKKLPESERLSTDELG